MKILIAEDESVSRRRLEASLANWGYEVIATSDGIEAWDAIQQPDAPELMVLDWLMPGKDGVDICRELRKQPEHDSDYVILLTSKGDKNDIIQGLESGADDYVTKPFDARELRARVQVGARMIKLQKKLAENIAELKEALNHVKQLHGLLPICAYCKRIRDDGNYWHKVESYIADHADVRFSHGVCPDCTEKLRAEIHLND